MNINPLESILVPSENVVVRVIEGEVIIIPIASGIGDAEDELYTLNSIGQAIWRELDGHRSLKEIAVSLSNQYNAPLQEIESDLLGFTSELTRRGILIPR